MLLFSLPQRYSQHVHKVLIIILIILQHKCSIKQYSRKWWVISGLRTNVRNSRWRNYFYKRTFFCWTRMADTEFNKELIQNGHHPYLPKDITINCLRKSQIFSESKQVLPKNLFQKTFFKYGAIFYDIIYHLYFGHRIHIVIN